MALITFSSSFPWGDPTDFEAKILGGIKHHTLRSGNAWYPGRLIDLWMGSPRNKGSYKLPTLEFDKALEWKTVTRKDRTTGEDYEVNLPVCSATEDWTMDFQNLFDDSQDTLVTFRIGDLEVDENLADVIAVADGFDNYAHFMRWFEHSARKKKTEHLEGQLIHWTDKVYDIDTANHIPHDYFNPPV